MTVDTRTIEREVTLEFDTEKYQWVARFAEFDIDADAFVREFDAVVPDSRFVEAKRMALGLDGRRQQPFSDAVFEKAWPEWVWFLYRAVANDADTAPYLYPELPQYQSSPSFVKSNPMNNNHYVWGFRDSPWYPFIKEAADALEKLAPGYNIDQVKSKFNDLCFYYTLPSDLTEEVKEKADAIVREAVEKTREFEKGNKQERARQRAQAWGEVDA